MKATRAEAPPKHPRAALETDDWVEQSMVDWLDPRVLLKTGTEAVLAAAIGQRADTREVQAASQRSLEYYDYRERDDDFWLDFVADLGDGFGSTHAVASALARDLDHQGVSLHRGEVLVLGGDLVYPHASRSSYWDRFVGPYSKALPDSAVEAGARPHLFAIPGNHDWYDGLAAFRHILCHQRAIGGWQTRQKRSYFALALPRGWWLWALDVQLHDYIDEPQVEYFAAMEAEAVRLQGETNPGQRPRLILCTARPCWIDYTRGMNEADRDAMRSLAFIEAHARRAGLDVRMTLAGDLHHYARFTAQPERPNEAVHRITAGGGGAYLYPTHQLSSQLDLPTQWRKGHLSRYDCAKTYPGKSESRALLKGMWLLPLRNRRFALLLGCLYALLGYSWAYSWTRSEGGYAVPDLLLALANPAGVALLIPMWATLAAFARAGGAKGTLGSLLLGGAHLASHVGSALCAIVVALDRVGVLGRTTPSLLGAGLAGVIVFSWGAVVGSLVFVTYLRSGHFFWGLHTNENFAFQMIDGFKSFVRIRIGVDGTLKFWAIGIRDVSSSPPGGLTVVDEGAACPTAGESESEQRGIDT